MSARIEQAVHTLREQSLSLYADEFPSYSTIMFTWKNRYTYVVFKANNGSWYSTATMQHPGAPIGPQPTYRQIVDAVASKEVTDVRYALVWGQV